MVHSNECMLELDGLTKSFPGILANDEVSFRVGRGEIHAVLGENGAGKSTLVKMIYGVLRPDRGAMTLDGKRYEPTNPAQARKLGIGMVFQHFSLFEALTVAENVELGVSHELAQGDLGHRIVEVSERYGLKLDPDRIVGELSVGERQRVEIVRCLLQNPRLIIMDEPTSVLTPQEANVLFETLRQLAQDGCSVLYISHKLDEIRALCDHATILRGGRVVANCVPSKETTRSLAELMIGKFLVAAKPDAGHVGEVRLRLRGMTIPSTRPFGVDLDDLSFDVRSGEILGIAGIAGNGQEELMEVLIGERLVDQPSAINLDGVPVGRLGPDKRRVMGLCCIPEERLGHGAVPGMSLTENIVLSARARKQLTKSGFIDLVVAGKFAEEVVAGFDVRTTGVGQAAQSLSGGNLQKFIVGREILQVPTVLVASQPTWGVDAGAAAAIRQALVQLSRGGAAVLIISQDLEELLSISDRISVIAGGRLTPAENVADVTVEEIGIKMGGQVTKRQSGASASHV